MRARDVTAGLSRSDVLVAVVVAAIGQQETWAPVHGFAMRASPLWAMSSVYAVSSAALLWRRRYPLLVVAVVNGALVLLYVASRSPDGLGTLLPPFVAFYAACRHGVSRQVPLAVLITCLGVAVHELRDPHFVFDGRTTVAWGVVGAAGLIGWAMRLRAGEAASERARAEMLERSRDEQAAQAVRAERDRLARELHDLVGHGMSLAVLQVMAAQATLEDDDQAGAIARLRQVERTTRETLDEMRRLVAVTSGDEAPLTPQPSLADLPRLVDDLRAAGAAVDLSLDLSVPVPPGISLTAYRVVQEALTNVIRHADAPAHVAVHARQSLLTIDVIDDGIGGDIDLDRGRGVLGMRQRVALYGGSLEVGRREPRGVHLCARLPLDGPS